MSLCTEAEMNEEKVVSVNGQEIKDGKKQAKTDLMVTDKAGKPIMCPGDS